MFASTPDLNPGTGRDQADTIAIAEGKPQRLSPILKLRVRGVALCGPNQVS